MTLAVWIYGIEILAIECCIISYGYALCPQLGVERMRCRFHVLFLAVIVVLFIKYAICLEQNHLVHMKMNGRKIQSDTK